MFRGGLGKEKIWVLLELKTLFSVQNSKAALLWVGSCFSTNKLALLITCINLYSHQQCQNPCKSLPCCLPDIEEADHFERAAARPLVNDLLSATPDTSLPPHHPFSSRKCCCRPARANPRWVTPEASTLTVECPWRARPHGQLHWASW